MFRNATSRSMKYIMFVLKKISYDKVSIFDSVQGYSNGVKEYPIFGHYHSLVGECLMPRVI